MACCLEGSCSIQLSYRSGIAQIYYYAFTPFLSFDLPAFSGMLYPAELPVRYCSNLLLCFYPFLSFDLPAFSGMLYPAELPVHSPSFPQTQINPYIYLPFWECKLIKKFSFNIQI